MIALPVTRVDVAESVLALTFDDGPSRWTDPILDVLRDHSVRATFFVIGDNIVRNERILRRIHDEGHEVGNHTLRHPRLLKIGADEIRRELELTSRAIEDVLGVAPRVFRPPGFIYDDLVARVVGECGFACIVNAEVWTFDWKEKDPALIVRTIVDRARAGSIIDLHDGRPPRDLPTLGRFGGSRKSRQPTVDAVREIVPRLKAGGFAFLTVSELLAR